MVITYLDHSGFVVELTNHILIFDYVKGALPQRSKDKLMYFFVSHRHGDHLHPHLGEVLNEYPGAYAIVSDDIRKVKEAEVIKIGPHQTQDIHDLHVETFLSTDEGVAFLVEVEGKVIYHAGDLHWWDWDEENEQERALMKQRYFQELNRFKGRTIDLAFLVLDPRLEENYWLGFDAFMRQIDVRHVLAMHCWDDYDIMNRFIKLPCSEPYRNRIIRYDHRGEQITLGGK